MQTPTQGQPIYIKYISREKFDTSSPEQNFIYFVLESDDSLALYVGNKTLSSIVNSEGVVPVSKGGTGRTTLTQNFVLVGNNEDEVNLWDTIDLSDIPSYILEGRASLSQLPFGTANFVLAGQGLSTDPKYIQLDFNLIEGRLPFSRIDITQENLTETIQVDLTETIQMDLTDTINLGDTQVIQDIDNSLGELEGEISDLQTGLNNLAFENIKGQININTQVPDIPFDKLIITQENLTDTINLGDTQVIQDIDNYLGELDGDIALVEEEIDQLHGDISDLQTDLTNLTFENIDGKININTQVPDIPFDKLIITQENLTETIQIDLIELPQSQIIGLRDELDGLENDINTIGADLENHKHDASDITSGTLPVAHGGTGVGTFPKDRVLVGDGTAPIKTVPTTPIQEWAMGDIPTAEEVGARPEDWTPTWAEVKDKPEEINLVDIPYIQNLALNVSDNTTNINTHTTQINTLNDELDTLEGTLSSLDARVVSNTNDISTINGEIVDINNTLLNKSEIGHTHESSDIIDAVNIDVVPLTTLYGNLPINRVTDLRDELDETIEDIKVNGTSLPKTGKSVSITIPSPPTLENIGGLLPVSKGGTGRDTLTQDRVLVGDGEDEVKLVEQINLNQIKLPQTQIIELEADLQALASGITTNTDNITNLTTRVETAEGTIDSLQSGLGIAQSSIISLDNRVGAAESNITTLDNKVTTNTTDITDLTARVGTAEDDIDDIQEELSNQINIDEVPIVKGMYEDNYFKGVQLDQEYFKITFTKRDDTTVVIDLPLESVVVDGSYDTETKEIILTLQNGTTIEINVADLVTGLVSIPDSAKGEASNKILGTTSTFKVLHIDTSGTITEKTMTLNITANEVLGVDLVADKVLVGAGSNQVKLVDQIPIHAWAMNPTLELTYVPELPISRIEGLQDELDGLQTDIGYTPENIANKKTSWSTTVNNINYPSEKLVKDSLDLKADKTYVDTQLATKQATLVSGTNIKSFNNQTLLGSGAFTIATNKVLGRTTADSGAVEQIDLININDLGLAKTTDIPAIPDIELNKTGTAGVITNIAVDGTNKHKLNIAQLSRSGIDSRTIFPTNWTNVGSKPTTLTEYGITLTGDVTANVNSNEITISNSAITTDKINNNAITNDKILNSTIALTKLADIASQTVLGNATSSIGAVEQIDLVNVNQIKVSDLNDGSLYALKTDIPTVTNYSGSDSIKLNGTSFERAALTGDITSSQNSNATTIANNVVTFAKMQNIATQRLLGRYSAGTGNVQPITIGSNLTLSTGGVLSATNTVYTHPNSGVTTGTYRSVTVNAQGHVTAGTNPTTLTGYGIALAGDVRNTNNTITIEPKAITLAKIDDISTGKVLGRTSDGPGVVEEISLININDLGLARTTDIPTDLSQLTNTPGFTNNIGTVTRVNLGGTDYNPVNGVINLPAYPTGTGPTYSGSTSITLSGNSFTRAALTGHVTASANSNVTTIANGVVTFAKMQNIATGKVLGRTTPNSGVIEEIDIGEISQPSWTQVWSGAVNLNSYTNGYYSAIVPSNSYIGKRIAIEVQYGSGTIYTSKIIFGVLGNSSVASASTSISRGIGWNYFDGTNLRVKTLYTYALTGNSTTIYVGNLKTLFGTFSGTTIDWSTSYSETLYMRKIWVIE